jgi:hypothetical protein
MRFSPHANVSDARCFGSSVWLLATRQNLAAGKDGRAMQIFFHDGKINTAAERRDWQESLCSSGAAGV